MNTAWPPTHELDSRQRLSVPQRNQADRIVRAPLIAASPRHAVIRRRRSAGFTMVEIALSLAIIGFAMVAIIGVLPTGLNVQRTNREETIINQEGNYFLEAIRSGAQGLNELTNYVAGIVISNAPAKPLVLTNSSQPNIAQLGGGGIIGLLSTPKYYLDPLSGKRLTNYNQHVVAKVRAMSGPAAEKNLFSRTNDLAFTYLIQSEILPFAAFPANSAQTNWPITDRALTPTEMERKDLWAQAQVLAGSLYELRLTLRWPVRPDGSVGDRRQTFRTLMSGIYMSGFYTNVSTGNPSVPLYFFRPSKY